MIYTVDEEHSGVRVDAYLAEISELSRSAAAKLCDGGLVEINGRPAEKKDKVYEGCEVSVVIPEVKEYEAEPEDIPLDIVFEDDDLIVINKPSGMVVHPAPGNYSGTLVNALLFHCEGSLSGIGGIMRPGIVHRIDKDTSGLLVVAKNDFTHTALSRELEYHGIEREYHALVRGGFPIPSGTVDMPIGRHPIDRKKMAIIPEDRGGKRAVTHYELIESFGNISYLKLRLETGRTHQIRVHMSTKGHPLLGDEVYSGSKIPFEKQHAPLFDGQALHAKRLTLTHPRSGERMTFECSLPENFEKLLRILRDSADR